MMRFFVVCIISLMISLQGAESNPAKPIPNKDADFVISLYVEKNIPYAKTEHLLKKSNSLGFSFAHQWIQRWVTGYSVDYLPIEPTANATSKINLASGHLFKFGLNQQIKLELPYFFLITPGFSLIWIASFQPWNDRIVNHRYLKPEVGFAVFAGIERQIYQHWNFLYRINGWRGLATTRFFFFSHQVGISKAF